MSSRTDLSPVLQIIKKIFPPQSQNSTNTTGMCYRTFALGAAVFLIRWTKSCFLVVDKQKIPHALHGKIAITCVLAQFCFKQLFHVISINACRHMVTQIEG